MSIRKTAEWLRNIEALNTEFREINLRLEQIPQVLSKMKGVLEQETQVVTQAQGLVTVQQDRISKLQGEIHQLEEDLKASEQRANDITNQKEYQATQKEMESVKNRRDMLNTQVEAEKKALEELDKKNAEGQATLKAHQEALEKQEPRAKTLVKDLEKKQKDFRQRIGNMEKELPETVTTTLERLAKNNIYPFTSEATQDSVCSVCNMGYPTQIVLNAVSEGVFAQCPHCYRLLIPGPWVFESA